ncbi:MAG: metallophosphoesterase [Clostridia bacterium]|nr:metallophosphoesterase [Clostridia bacterium]
MIVIKGGEIYENTENDGFEPVLRFFVCSDIHIKKYNDIRCRRLIRMMRTAHNISADYGGVDALLFAGDITDRGRRSQYRAFSHIVKRESRGARILAVTAKNHDNWSGGKKGNGYYSSLLGSENDFHTVIHGVHFIGISTCDEPGVYYSESQRDWLDEQLSKASEESPGKPVFVMHHEHVKNTVYGSSDFDGWGNDYFRDILNKYPSVIHFSGHSHYPLNDPRSLWQGEFTAVGTGTLNYAEFTVDAERKLHPGGCGNISQCWMADVDGNGRVLLRGLDCMYRTVLCEYLLEPPFDCSDGFFERFGGFYPAPRLNGKGQTAIFETEDKIAVTFPASATLYNNPCFIYRVFLFDDNENIIDSTYVINEYWRKSRRQHYTAYLKKPGCSCRAAVCAENSFGKRSEFLWV